MRARFGSVVFFIVRRSLRQHVLSTAVTVFAVALASALVMSVFTIESQSRRAFTGGPIGFDAVLGARGSQLQLVLNSVFHLETSPGNIPWSLYEEVKNDPRVSLAVPYATGDSYLGYRIVGTTQEIFTRFEYQRGKSFEIDGEGRLFDPGYAEAVLGSFVAQKTGLAYGDTFHPSHGIASVGASEHAEEYTVVGIMKPTNSPSDRVIWIPIDGIYWMGGHVLRGAAETFTPKPGEAIPDDAKEVSAVMLTFRNARAGFDLDRVINKEGRVATLAYPIGRVMAELFDKVGWLSRVLHLVAYLVVAVSAGAILASVYNTINERRREFAILRSLGARRRTVFTVIVSEAAAIAGLGSLLGFVVHAGILAVATRLIRDETGVVLDVFEVHPVVWLTPLGMLIVGALAGVIPATKAYATDVADHLAPHS